MSSTLTKKLESLSSDDLIQILVTLSEADKESKKRINTLASLHNPKELAKVINKDIGALKRSTKYIDYSEVFEFAKKLDFMADNIHKHLSKQAPDVAINLCQKVIDIDSSLFERVDDSYGLVGNFYGNIFSALDKALAHASLSATEIATLCLDIYKTDSYGNRSMIVDALNHCLSEDVMVELERLMANNRLSEYSILYFKQLFADKRKNIEAYIQCTQQQPEGIRASDIFEIAKRFNNQGRGDDAITWLDKFEASQVNKHSIKDYQYKCDTLYREAYHLECDIDNEKKTVWRLFLANLDPKHYFEYFNMASPEEKKIAQESAMEQAHQNDSLEDALSFLIGIHEYEKAGALFLKRIDDVHSAHYSVYRKLSTTLHKNGEHLAAVMMRRTLVDDVLARSITKYYKYAVSDFTMSLKFGQHVQDWQSYEDNHQYLAELKELHFRKTSLWSLLEQSDYEAILFSDQIGK